MLRRSSSQALLLPRIQPLGEIDADEVLVESAPAGTLPAAMPPLRRQLLLARLFERSGWPMIHALRLAQELASLLDELQTERVALGALASLVPDHLAEHWERNRDVLAVIAEAWPRLLAEESALDPAERRHRLLTGLAAQWRAAAPARRIVAAGSTGSIPATRALLRVIATLPRGTVVLPGLDQEMDEASWRVLPAAHSQYGLKQLLDALDLERAAVGRWPAPGVAGSDPARARLLSEAMRPAATINAWQRLASPLPAAIEGYVTRCVDAPMNAAKPSHLDPPTYGSQSQAHIEQLLPREDAVLAVGQRRQFSLSLCIRPPSFAVRTCRRLGAHMGA